MTTPSRVVEWRLIDSGSPVTIREEETRGAQAGGLTTLREPVATAGRGLDVTAADHDLARLTKALGHPVRVAIVRYLLEQGESVCMVLSHVVPLAHSTTMQHIKVLRDAGLLCSGKSGRNVLYCVNSSALRELRALVGRL